MERLTTYKNNCKREMICRYEDCDTCEEYCPHMNEDNCPCLQEVLEKLAYYEDLEERLTSIYGECDGLLENVVAGLEKHEGAEFEKPIKARLLTDGEVDRWEEYKRLEEQGKLLKLPCAVGDTVYRVNKGAKEPIIPMKVCEVGVVSLKVGGFAIQIMCRDEINSGETYYINTDIGKTVFITKEAAEAALKRN